MSKNSTNLIGILLLLAAVTACVCPSGKNQGRGAAPDPSDPPPRTSASPSAPAKNGSKTDDQGDFIVEHEPVKSAKFAEIDRQIRSEKLLEKAADRLNQSLILPHDITLRSAECNEVNAFYRPEDPSVTVCFELMEHFYDTFRSSGDSSEKAYSKMFDAVRFVFLHEIGHALIDTYSLPVTGNEEDAADRCSAYINIEELGQDGASAVLAAAEAFQIEAKHSNNSDRQLADEHLLQSQRFFNSLCMLYGSDPDKYQSIVTQGFLPKERAGRCQFEYTRTRDSWTNLLEPWRKN